MVPGFPGIFTRGEEYDVSEEVGKGLLATKQFEKVKAKKPKAEKPTTEEVS